MSDKMREALQDCLDDLEYLAACSDSAYARPDAEVISKAKAVLAERPAQGEAAAWRFSPYPAAPKFRVLTEDPDAAQFARDCGVAVTELFTAPPATSVPEGWQLVPIVMPDRMVAIMHRAKLDGWDLHGMWAELLAAAPFPTTTPNTRDAGPAAFGGRKTRRE